MFAIGVENQLGFAIVMLVGGAVALGLGGVRCRKAGISLGKTALATVAFPLLTLFFAHLLYCLTDLEYTLYTYSAGYLFAFWESGHMVYGGMLGAVLALLLVGGKDFPKLMEQYAPSGAWMIAVTRIGEGLLGQGYGEYATGESAFNQFPFMVYDPYYEEWGWALFMLEALIALLLFAVLLRKKKSWQGDSALLFMGLYASAQVVLESFRRDEFLRWGFVRVEQLFSVVLILVVLISYGVRSGRGKGVIKALIYALYAAMVTLCILLEFAMEGRIPFLMFLDVDACYLAEGGACLLLACSVLWMRRISAATNPAKERNVVLDGKA